MIRIFCIKLFIITIIINTIYGGSDIIKCNVNCTYKYDIKNLAKDFCEQKIFKKTECLSEKEKGCMSFYFQSQVIEEKRLSFSYTGCYDDEFINFAKKLNFTNFPPNTYIDSTIEWKGYNFYVFGSRNTLF
uniref:Uncharacterized protein n=1 Tax=Strongyloides stercoralis TaxID=6248 RepID=A0A0K0EQ71_STRER